MAWIVEIKDANGDDVPYRRVVTNDESRVKHLERLCEIHNLRVECWLADTYDPSVRWVEKQ